jgi:hypothetical protein
MRWILDKLGRGIAYVGVCIMLGERPAAWTIAAWSKSQMRQAKREYEERAAKLDEMVQRAMSKAYTPPMTPVELELPPMSGHKAPEGSN